MASETLSQQEIDLLFSGSAVPAAAPRERKQEVQIYDFHRPNLISKDKLRALEAMYGHLGKALENWLMTRVRGHVEFQLLGVEQFSFGEFVLSLPNPCSSFVYDIADAGGQQAVADFGREFAFFLVDRLLGSTGAPLVEDRVLTPLERMVVRIVADRLAALLNEVWQSYVRLNLSLSRFETMPDMLRIANREDPVLVANMQVHADGLESSLLVCLPFAVLEKFFTATGQGRVQAARSAPRERQLERRGAEVSIRKALVPITARMPLFNLGLRDLAALRTGQTVLTGLPADAALTVMVADHERFTGLAGRSGRSLAIRITQTRGPGDGATHVPPTGRIAVATTAYGKSADAGEEALEFEELEGAGDAAGAAGLSSLFHLSLPITIELGRTSMSVQDVLELGRGSVIQLDRLVGEPVDVMVGNRRFAEGEVVVLGEQFGVRITRVLGAANGNGVANGNGGAVNGAPDGTDGANAAAAGTAAPAAR